MSHVAKTVLLTLPLFIVTFLGGCSHGFNPQTSSLSAKDQCITLQRQMLFINSPPTGNAGDDRWINQVDRTQLQKEFHQLNCYQVLNGSSGN